VSEDVDATPNVLIYSGLGLKGDTLDLTLNRSNIWVFCSEVQFEGTPIPLPPAFVLLGSGVLVLAGAGRWRRR
jgi:hypothetical protein